MTHDEIVAKYQFKSDAGTPLDGIEITEWSALQHGYGNAGDVPAILRASLSQDKADRESSIKLLFETLWHGGTIYTASYPVIPYLFEMIESDKTPDKSSIAMLIARIATGQPYITGDMLHSHAARKTWEPILARQGLTLEDAVEQGQNLRLDIQAAIAHQFTELLPYLEDSNPEVRLAVIEACGVFPEHVRTTLPLLKKAFTTEKSDAVTRAIEASVKRLSESSQKK